MFAHALSHVFSLISQNHRILEHYPFFTSKLLIYKAFLLFCSPRIIRTLRIKGFYHYLITHSHSLTSKALCGTVEAQHVKTCCRVNRHRPLPDPLFNNVPDTCFISYEAQTNRRLLDARSYTEWIRPEAGFEISPWVNRRTVVSRCTLWCRSVVCVMCGTEDDR